NITANGGNDANDIGNGSKSYSYNIKITGGNIYASSIGATPTNDADVPVNVYRATFTIPDDTAGGVELDDIRIYKDGTPYNYGMKDTKSILIDGAGKLFVYLPTGTYSLNYSDKVYTAVVDTSGNTQFTVAKNEVTNSGGSAEVTYTGTDFDLDEIDGLFTVDSNAGVPTYSIETGGTGTGSISGTTLTVTKAGTFNIGLVTAETEEYAAGSKVTATLTVNKGTQSAPMGLGKSDVTANGGSDGKITGLAPNTGYEYKKDSGSYVAATSNASGEITGLSAGSYAVRLPETDLYNASPDSTAVVISQPGNGGSGSSGGSGGSTNTPPTPPPAITVTEVQSELFTNTEDIIVEADVTAAFGQPVEVKITDKEESQNEIFQLTGADDEVYPFDISLYSRTSGEKVQPKEGYSVKITLPIPEKLLVVRDKVKVVYVRDGKLEVLSSQVVEKDGKWYITFEAVHFSPYALIVSKEPADTWTNPFSDVKEGSWYYSAVQYVAQNGLMFGTGNDTFSPQLATNRGMIATILYRLSGSPETLESTFRDVIPGAYYAKAVAWAEKQGIISGYGNGMFGPEDSITREQMAAMLWRYAGSPSADTSVLNSFNDAGEISDYAKQALAWAYTEGIMAGKGNGILDLKGYATRVEAAVILTNYLKTK
ncbi:MAG: S-layer homology domain-containing protein, partial [Clostridiaceae bacterium]|nr:S-layer homology domain-containing protein [Clostridiaceae bacterium]